MTISKIIQDIETIIEKQESVNMQINNKKIEMNIDIENISEKFNLLKISVDEFYQGIKRIVEQLLQIYINDIRLENNRIIYEKSKIEKILIDEENCFEIFKSIQTKLIEDLKSLYMSEDSSMLIEISSQYNAIIDIYELIDKLKLNKLTKNNEKIENEISILKLQEIELEETKKRLINEINLYIDKNIQSKSYIVKKSLNFEKKYNKDILIPFAKLTNNNVSFLKSTEEKIIDYCFWKLNSEGILHVKTNNNYILSEGYIEIVKNLIINQIVCYPNFSKKLLICDATNNFELRSFIAKISGKTPQLVYKNTSIGDDIHCTEESIATSLEEISKLINNRISLLGWSEYDSILDYNEKNQDNIQPIIFVNLFAYPYGLSSSQKFLESLLTNGKRAGVYSNSDVHLDSWIENKLPDINKYGSMNFDYSGDTKEVILDNQHYTPYRLNNDFNIIKLLEEIEMKDIKEEGFVYFNSILENENVNELLRREFYSKELVLPIGKKGSNVINLILDSEGDTHAIMCGATGSGKSSLLSTIILSAASLYSPDELEIYVFDMIKTEFEIYKKHKLPHLKTIITGDDVIGANDILDYLIAEQQRRETIFAGKGSIVQYNNSVEKSKRLPRVLIIIDEYQKLIDDDNALNKICSLAQSGRSCGMSLILSSQTLPTLFNKQALTNFAHKFEFKSASAGELLYEAETRKSELESLKGLCLYNSKNDKIGADLIRVAYWDKENGGLETLINNIVNKYSNYKMELNNSIKMYEIDKIDNFGISYTKSKRTFEEDGVCYIPLGIQYLFNTPIGYSFSNSNNKLCVCGDYLLSKNIELSIIKEFLILSKDSKNKSVFYIDFNQNPNWRKKENILKPRINELTIKSQGRFAYYFHVDAIDALDEIQEIIKNRQDINCDDFSPVLVFLSCVEEIEADDEIDDKLENLLKIAKSANVYFALHFSEFHNRGNSVFRSIDSVIKDAIIIPDKAHEGEKYSSVKLMEFLDRTQAGEVSAKNLISTLKVKALDPRLYILCNNNSHYCFVPYILTEEFFKNINI